MTTDVLRLETFSAAEFPLNRCLPFGAEIFTTYVDRLFEDLFAGGFSMHPTGQVQTFLEVSS
jgi:hypothetical protein